MAGMESKLLEEQKLRDDRRKRLVETRDSLIRQESRKRDLINELERLQAFRREGNGENHHQQVKERWDRAEQEMENRRSRPSFSKRSRSQTPAPVETVSNNRNSIGGAVRGMTSNLMECFQQMRVRQEEPRAVVRVITKIGPYLSLFRATPKNVAGVWARANARRTSERICNC
ncbi:unnamed protein product, partial [Mesorhabditis spiculigera]